MPGAAPASSATTCEPSSCTSNQPFWKAGSACTLGWRPEPSIGGMRMPLGASASARPSCRTVRSSTRSRSAFSVLTRRSSGGLAERPAASATQSSPKASSSSGAHQSGQSARISAGASSSRRVLAVCNSSSRQRRRREPVAFERGVQPLGGLVPFEQQRAETQGARRVGIEQPAGRALPAQRVVDDVADRGAVAGAGEAMRQAPILQRIRRRPVPPRDVFQHVYGCRQPSAETHGLLQCRLPEWRVE